MTGITLYNSLHRPQTLIVFEDVLNIPQYQIAYQLSERRTSMPVKSSGFPLQRNPRLIICSHCGEIASINSRVGNQLPPNSGTF